MAARTILTWPNKKLKRKSDKVESINQGIKDLCFDLFDTLKVNFAIGVAAPQVNEFKRVCLIKSEFLPSLKTDDQLEDCVVVINPTIKILDSRIVQSQESCLSVPGLVEVVNRHNKILLEYTDLSNNINCVEVTGRESCILQHEIDHLDGKLFLDRMSRVKRLFFDKKVKKAASLKKKLEKPDKEKMSKIKSALTRKKNRENRKKKKR